MLHSFESLIRVHLSASRLTRLVCVFRVCVWTDCMHLLLVMSERSSTAYIFLRYAIVRSKYHCLYSTVGGDAVCLGFCVGLKKLRKKDGDKDGMSDDNKIRLQLYLDAFEFKRQVQPIQTGAQHEYTHSHSCPHTLASFLTLTLVFTRTLTLTHPSTHTHTHSHTHKHLLSHCR